MMPAKLDTSPVCKTSLRVQFDGNKSSVGTFKCFQMTFIEHWRLNTEICPFQEETQDAALQ